MSLINNTNNNYYATLEDFGAIGDGIHDDRSAWQSLLNTKPVNINCNPNATYYLSGEVFTKNSVNIYGNGAIFLSSSPLSSNSMSYKDIIGTYSKGDVVLNLSDSIDIAVGTRALIYYGCDNNDSWYIANQRNPNELGITSQLVTVESINGSQIIINKGLDQSPYQGYAFRLYLINDEQPVIHDLNFHIQGKYYANKYSCNMTFNRCSFSYVGSEDRLSIRFQTCFNMIWKECTFNELTQLGINYGSSNCVVEQCTFYDGYPHDGLLVTFAGCVHILSKNNKFLHRNGPISNTVSGVYFGAKSRYCVSEDDYVDGIGLGFRAMFGCLYTTFSRFISKHTVATYAVIISCAQYTTIKSCKIYGTIRTLDVDHLYIVDNYLLSNYRGVGTPPLMIDLNRIDSAVRANDYAIIGNTIQGELRSWVSIDNLIVERNKAEIFNTVTNGSCVNVKISDNTFGWLRLYGVLGGSITGNNIDYTTLDDSALSKPSAVEFAQHNYLDDFSGNRIKHPALGIYRGNTSPLCAINFRTGNNVIALIDCNLGITSASSPANESVASNYISAGGKACLDGYGAKHQRYWLWLGSEWVLADNTGIIATYNLSFKPNANGIFSASPRTLKPISIGDRVIVNCPMLNPSEGEYLAEVTAQNTLQIFYRDYTGAPSVVNHTVYVTVSR